jgi:YfiH family protein
LTPAVADPFEWRSGPAGLVLQDRALGACAQHVFTTRSLSFRGQSAESELARVAEACGRPPANVVGLTQVHGRHVALLRPGDDWPGRPEADAIVSTDPARVVTVRVADCVPVLLADRNGRAVAAVHAGWRGTAAGVAGAAVERMETEGIRPADLVASIGPSIGPCCYEVGEVVWREFLKAWPDAPGWFSADRPGRWRLDLWQATVDQLVRAGVGREAIGRADVCTRHHEGVCHSYRREGDRAGRMVAAICAGRPGEAPGALRT